MPFRRSEGRSRRVRGGLTVLAVAGAMSITVPAAEAATTLYVDQNNPRCSNTGAGSETTPFCSISKAAAVVTAGQTVQVLSGTYVENVTPANSGSASAPILFRPAPGAVVTVSGQIHAFTVNAKSWITITGFNVTGTTQYGIYLKGASHVTLSGNHVTSSGQPVSGSTAQGIYLINTTDSLITGNTTDHNTDTGIYLTTGNSGNEIRGNTSFANSRQYTRAATGIDVRSPGNTVVGNRTYGNEDSGIQLYNGANGTVVQNNLSYGNGDHGIDVLNSTNTVIVANTVYDNTTAGINLEGATGSSASSGGTLRNNISVDNGLRSSSTKGNIRVDAKSLTGTTLDYDLVSLSQSGTMMTWGSKTYTTLAAFNTASGQDDHGLQADPQWVSSSTGDFHLRTGSPAIDSADSTAPGQPVVDIDGNPRVDDPSSPNIGVGPRTYDDRGSFEFQPDQPPVAALTLSPSSGDAPLVVTADASGSTDDDSTPISTYTFDFGDGTPADGPQASASASHTYATPGNYTVVVTVTDTGGRSSTASATATVTSRENPPVAALAVTPSSGAAPLDVTADASGSTDPDETPIATYTFDFGDGSAPVGPQSSAVATHTYGSSGSYVLTVTVTDTSGASGTATATVNVGAATVDEVHYSFLTPTSVAFDWRGGPDTIRYGTTASYGASVRAATPNPAPYSSAGPYWEAQLTGLSLGTTYHYSIGGSPDSTFTTAPTGNFRFVVEADMGDSVTYPRMGVIQSQITADHPDAVLAAGDLTYGEAHGQQAVDQHFNDVMGWSRTAAYMPAWGNHEWEATTDDLRNYKGRFDIPNQAASPGAPSLGCCGEDWGWFDAGGVRFISYPEPYAGTTWSTWAPQADTIMAAAQADSTIHFIVTFGHRPAYSTGNHIGETAIATILDSLGDRYPKYVLNFNGHSHDYERFRPIHGVTHITSGGGGAALETPWSGTDPRTAYRAMHMEYVRVDVTASSLSVQAICGPSSSADDLTCTQGSVIDSATIAAPGDDRPPAAALTVTPSTGTTPLAVTADASASTDDDATPIGSYAFDFGDGTPLVGPQAAPTATHTYQTAGAYDVKVTVTDTAGRPSVATAKVTVNPSDSPPAARLSLTPTSGSAPLSVTADGSGSTDSDESPIASYRFDFGDGVVIGPQAGSSATHEYPSAGTYTVSLRVTDTAGLFSTATATVTVTPPAGANLVANSGFETNTTGWNNNGRAEIALSRVSGGHSGGWAAALTNTSTSSQPDCTLNDSPNWVKATQAGTYRAGLWVRADAAGAVLKLRLREYNGGTFVSSATAQITLSTAWQQITVNYSPQVVGSTLDYTAYISSAAPGRCFYADDASVAAI